jgi:hypothetical protein
MSTWTIVTVDDGSFTLSDAGQTAPDTLGFTTGLIATMDIGAMISTGIHTGPVQVHVQVLQAPPSDHDLHEWDDVCEASIHAPHGDLRVTPLYQDAPTQLPLLRAAGPGWYRVRAHARGRETAPDQVRQTPVEQYRLTAWPAPPTTPLILRATDRVGRGLRTNVVHEMQPPPTPRTTAPPWEEKAAANLRSRAKNKQS